MTADTPSAHPDHDRVTPDSPAGGARRLDVAAVLAALTLEEKAALLDGADAWRTERIDRPDGSLTVPSVMVADAFSYHASMVSLT